MSKFKNLVFFVLLPVVMTTLGEFILKFSVNQEHMSVSEYLFSFNFNSFMVLFSTFLIIAGGVLWLVAMSKFELSFLYPFLSINYVGIVIGSQFVLKEEVSIYRYISIIFIVIGLIFISRSPYSKKES
ncbi:hypothetical protein HOG98_09815 [bacterium]|jgi:multidrug transporter EmrE-like cation transporter|nr:hypothetical protein [bacterium]